MRNLALCSAGMILMITITGNENMAIVHMFIAGIKMKAAGTVFPRLAYMAII